MAGVVEETACGGGGPLSSCGESSATGGVFVSPGDGHDALCGAQRDVLSGTDEVELVSASLIDEDGLLDLLSEAAVVVFQGVDALLEAVNVLSECDGVLVVGSGPRGRLLEGAADLVVEDIGVLAAVATLPGDLGDGVVVVAGVQKGDQAQASLDALVGGGQAEIVFDGDPTPGRG